MGSSLSSQHTPFSSLSPCRVSFLQRLTAGDQEMPPPRWVSGGPFCSVMLKGGTENRIKEERLLIVIRLADVYILCGAEGYSGRSGVCPRGPWMTPVPGSVSGTWALGWPSALALLPAGLAFLPLAGCLGDASLSSRTPDLGAEARTPSCPGGASQSGAFSPKGPCEKAGDAVSQRVALGNEQPSRYGNKTPRTLKRNGRN